MRARETGAVVIAMIAFVAALSSQGCASAGSSDPCEPQTLCGGRCTAIKTDPANCGACGHACAVGQVCQAGACAEPAALSYSDDFTVNVSSAAQCAKYSAFIEQLRPPYTSITISGSRDAVGVTCNDPVTVSSLVQALQEDRSTAAVYTCNGRPWQVCWRGSYSALWVGTSILCDGADCPATGYMLRPCFPSSGFWGGINTGSNVCAPPSQSMSVTFAH